MTYIAGIAYAGWSPFNPPPFLAPVLQASDLHGLHHPGSTSLASREGRWSEGRKRQVWFSIPHPPCHTVVCQQLSSLWPQPLSPTILSSTVLSRGPILPSSSPGSFILRGAKAVYWDHALITSSSPTGVSPQYPALHCIPHLLLVGASMENRAFHMSSFLNMNPLRSKEELVPPFRLITSHLALGICVPANPK